MLLATRRPKGLVLRASTRLFFTCLMLLIIGVFLKYLMVVFDVLCVFFDRLSVLLLSYAVELYKPLTARCGSAPGFCSKAVVSGRGGGYGW